MKISEIFKKKDKTFSFEFFPPKTDKAMSDLINAVTSLKGNNPDFVSVTYGAMGTTQDTTLSVIDIIQNKLNLTAMSHLTCVGSTAHQIQTTLDQLKSMNIENIMALRGDPPAGSNEFIYTPGGFRNGSDLIKFINASGNFSIGAAGYPEGHIESESLTDDLNFLKLKQDNGADFIVTQLFLDNSYYYNFRESAQDKGINIRLIPGIMPVTNIKQINKFSELCGCTIPARLKKSLERVRNDPESIRKIGIEHAINQGKNLLENGAPGLHFYTLNKSPETQEIFKELI